MEKLIIFWLPLLASNAMVFPIKITSNDCTFHTIFTNITKFNPAISQILSHNTIIIPTIFQTLENLEDSFEESQDTVQVDHFRFRDPICLIFYIFLNSFAEILSAVRNSGHGTSDQAIFLASLPDNNSIGFLPDQIFEMEGDPFHAPIAFHQTSHNELQALCYFCPTGNKLFHLKPPISLEQLHSLNDHGFGLTVTPEFSITSNWGMTSDCFPRPDITRKELYLRFISCYNLEFLVLNQLAKLLNVTFQAEYTEKPKPVWADWFLRVKFYEGFVDMYYFQEQMAIRANYFFMTETVPQWIACKEENEDFGLGRYDTEQLFDLVFNATILLAALVAVVLYGALSQNILYGLDLLRLLFGQGLDRKHQRHLLLSILMTFTFLGCFYSATISSDSIRHLGFPGFAELIMKQGYRFLIEGDPDKENLAWLLKSQLDTPDGKLYEKYFGVNFSREPDKYVEMFDLEPKAEEGVSDLFNESFSSYLEPMVRNKWIFYWYKEAGWVSRNGAFLRGFGGSHICQISNYKDELKSQKFLPSDVKFWGYLRGRASEFQRRFIDMGLYKWGNRWMKEVEDQRYKGFKDSRLAEPKAMELISPIGVLAAIQFLYGFGLLLCFGVNGTVKLARSPRSQRKLIDKATSSPTPVEPFTELDDK